jgi:hypothetical protein
MEKAVNNAKVAAVTELLNNRFIGVRFGCRFASLNLAKTKLVLLAIIVILYITTRIILSIAFLHAQTSGA